jgi:transposase-like protein
MLKEMFAETIQEMPEAELDTELGYPKNGSKPNGAENRRNGHTGKKVRSGFGRV